MPVPADLLLAGLTAAGGLSAAVFTGLRHNRDDATAVVSQQATVLEGMRALNDELQEALDRARAERDLERERRLELALELERTRRAPDADARE